MATTQNDTDASNTRRRRLSDEGRDEAAAGGGGAGAGAGRDESNRKRRRRILSCDTCRRQKCRCELDEESDQCSRCRSLRITCTWNDSGDTHSVSSREAPSKPEVEGSGTKRSQLDRIKSMEASIADLKATVEMLVAGGRPEFRRTLVVARQEKNASERNATGGSVIDDNDGVGSVGSGGTVITIRPPGNEDVEPADRHVSSSLAEVVRKVGSQLSGGFQRTFKTKADVVSLGKLDVKTARDLLAEPGEEAVRGEAVWEQKLLHQQWENEATTAMPFQFVQRRKHTLLLNSEVDLAPRSRDLRTASPFLHDVCCLHAMRFSQHSTSNLHRELFDHVKGELSRLMIESPLPLEELLGILIMSLWACAPTNPEYVDSWLLSGHCAQQAMLSINFSEILTRTKTRTATEDDQRVMRFWANTCLVNLHWAATTGRPATVPPAYLTQCKLLLNFEEVTMRDAMLYAEITLYLILHDKFSQRSYLGADGDCEELTAWRSRWSYLFDLPAASTLRISHSIAWLILARRTLEHDQASSDQDSLSSSPRLQPADAVRQEPHLPSQNPELWNLAHARVCNLATEVVRAFVEMPSARAEELPEFHRLCVAYAMLIISKYEQKPPYGGAEGGVTRSMEVLQLLKAAQKQNAVWSASSPSAIQFGLERALKKVTARVEGAAHGSAANPRAGPTPATAMTIDDRAPHRIGMLSPNNVQGAAAGAPMSWGHHHPDVMGQQQHDHPSSFTNATLLPEFEESFEMIGNFFNGGHLSLGDPSLMDMFQK